MTSTGSLPALCSPAIQLLRQLPSFPSFPSQVVLFAHGHARTPSSALFASALSDRLLHRMYAYWSRRRCRPLRTLLLCIHLSYMIPHRHVQV